MAQEALGRGDAAVAQAARVDQVKVRQVRGHVQGDAVIADTVFNSQAERAQFARTRRLRIAPAARQLLDPTRRNTEGRRRIDHGLLERAHQRPQEDAAVGQTNDGIGDQLAGPVIGHLAAALHADQLDPLRGKLF